MRQAESDRPQKHHTPANIGRDPTHKTQPNDTNQTHANRSTDIRNYFKTQGSKNHNCQHQTHQHQKPLPEQPAPHTDIAEDTQQNEKGHEINTFITLNINGNLSSNIPYIDQLIRDHSPDVLTLTETKLFSYQNGHLGRLHSIPYPYKLVHISKVVWGGGEPHSHIGQPSSDI